MFPSELIKNRKYPLAPAEPSVDAHMVPRVFISANPVDGYLAPAISEKVKYEYYF